MKKLFSALSAGLFSLSAIAQTFPSPTFNSVTLQNPLSPSSGGTGVANSSTITLGGNLVTSGASPLTFTTTGSTNITLPTSGTLLTGSTGATSGANSNITSLSGLTTPLSIPQGGTGSSTLTSHGVVVGQGSAALNATAAGAAGSVLAGNGASADPTFQTLGAMGIATLASPTFTGSPIAPTASLGTNSAQIATTAFVANRGPCANIMDFGGNNTGASNNDAAFSSTLSAASNTTNNKCIYFPPGLYTFSGQIGNTFTASNQSFTILGAGQDNTVLSWASNGGIGFNLLNGTDSVHVHDLTVQAGSNGTGTGIVLTHQFTSTSSAAMNTIQRVAIRGSDGYFGAHFFGTGIQIVGVSSVNIDSVQAIGPTGTGGTGLSIGTDNVAVVPIVYNISNSSFNNWNIGFSYGNLVQGVQISNCNFTNDAIGINVPAGETGLDQLNVVNSQFNVLAGQPNVLVSSPIENLQFSNNLFILNNNSSGINIQSSSVTTITGNSFQPNQASPSNVFGIVVSGWAAAGGIITGNSFFNLTTGIALQSGSKNFNVQSNVYQANAGNTSNSGTGNVIGGGSP